MVAVVTLNEKNGAGEIATDKTSGVSRYKDADNALVNLLNPLTIPAAGAEMSFQKFHRLDFQGTFTQITNIRFFMDGANGWGAGILGWAKAVATYATPAKEVDNTSYTDMFSFTSAAPLVLGAGPFTVVGEQGSYVQSMVELSNLAVLGVKTQEATNYTWDEI